MDNGENLLNGFQVFDDLFPGGAINKKNDEIDDLATGELTDEELDELRSKDQINNNDDEIDDDPDEIIEEEPIKQEPKAKRGPGRPKKSSTPNIEPDPISQNNENSEGDLVSSFFDSLADKLGWDDIEDEEKPKSVEDLIDYFAEVIQENSVPTYSNDEIAALDEYVRNGGSLKDYIKIDQQLDFENLEIEGNEGNQRAVLRELLKEKGYNDNQITKKLNKYEDAGILEDEALDAVESLKELKEQKKEELLRQQKIIAQQNAANQ